MSAAVPPGTPTVTAAALRSIASIERWPSFSEMRALRAYYDCTQYDGRPFNWDGSLAASPVGAEPAYLDWMPRLDQRKPPAVYPIARTIVERTSAMLFGEDRFPAVKVEDDPASEDFLAAVVDAVDLATKMAHARDIGGSVGAAAISWGWTASGPVVEVHDPSSILVLAWADAAQGIPAHVIKWWRGPAASVSIDALGNVTPTEALFVREWRAPKEGEAGAETLYRYVAEAPERWTVEGTIDIDECPIAWVTNGAPRGDASGALLGRADYEGSEGLIDALNLTLCATTQGTAINADPTLVIDAGRPVNAGERVKKGGTNTLFVRDAKYLEISGSSVEAGLRVTDRLRAFALESSHVVIVDPEKISGAHSGVALRLLNAPTVQHCSGLRSFYGAALVRVLRGLLLLAQRIEAKPLPMVKGANGEPMQASGWEWGLPPRVVKSGASTPDGNAQEVVHRADRRPGMGRDVRVVWGPFFAPDANDDRQRVDTIAICTTARIVSQRTAISMAKPITKVANPDQELADIYADLQRLEEVRARAL